jgi:hypothetical protein
VTALSLIDNKDADLFSYAALDRATEVAARSDAALIKGLMRRTAEDIITIGEALIRQKANLPHGMFLKWIEAEFDMSESAARKMMGVARQYGGKSVTVTDLGTRALYELAAPSTPPEVEAEVERRIAAGELVSAADIKALKLQARTAQDRATELSSQTEILKDTNRDLIANASREAREASESKFGAEIAVLKRRVEAAERAAAASIDQSRATAPIAETTVIAFAPKPIEGGDANSATEEQDLNDIDIELASNRAHAVCGALSTIDLVQIEPSEFWAVFGSEGLKSTTLKWVETAIQKLTAIKKGS